MFPPIPQLSLVFPLQLHPGLPDYKQTHKSERCSPQATGNASHPWLSHAVCQCCRQNQLDCLQNKAIHSPHASLKTLVCPREECTGRVQDADRVIQTKKKKALKEALTTLHAAVPEPAVKENGAKPRKGPKQAQATKVRIGLALTSHSLFRQCTSSVAYNVCQTTHNESLHHTHIMNLVYSAHSSLNTAHPLQL